MGEDSEGLRDSSLKYYWKKHDMVAYMTCFFYYFQILIYGINFAYLTSLNVFDYFQVKLILILELIYGINFAYFLI